MEFINKGLEKVKSWTWGVIPSRTQREQPSQPPNPSQEGSQRSINGLSSVDLEALSKMLLTFCEENRNSLMVCGSGGIVLSVIYHSTIMRTALIFGGGLFAYHKYASTPQSSANPDNETAARPRI